MNRHVYWAGPLAALVLAMLFFGVVYNFSAKIPHGFYEPYVKVELPDGHGSGTHIGGGYILTAGHVAASFKEATIKTNKGNILVADVQWVNRELDVALLKLRAPAKMAMVPLDCGEGARVGDRVRAYGNPIYLESVYTAGEVVGNPIKLGSPNVFTIDMTAAPGMSGGGIIGPRGTLVGILVGGMGNGFAFTFAVPSSTVCSLLARTA